MKTVVTFLSVLFRTFLGGIFAWTLLAYVVIGPEKIVAPGADWLGRGALIVGIVTLIRAACSVLPRRSAERSPTFPIEDVTPRKKPRLTLID
jgi:hypothetical protein